ncbi:hypothetical protein KSP39_PZI024011 [Platanthera zijinensis]|uniref:Uncharacterized protein n=1 Tax=Platanthera zijinensis TaxID=2320716 RepID=A0AAP0ATR9_9ASPA
MARFLRLEKRRHFSPPVFSFSVQPEQISRPILRQSSLFCSASSSSTLGGDVEERCRKEKGKWLNLPPFSPQKDPSSLAKELAGGNPAAIEEATTALKWVRRCFPHFPASLVQKLFRLRQVRKKIVPISTTSGDQIEAQQLKRVSAKELMSSGEVIFLPMTVQNSMKRNNEKPNNHDEILFIRGLILYKDPAIIVINKPHGLPVQGGYGIKNSIDLLAATSLKFDYPESPRLVS